MPDMLGSTPPPPAPNPPSRHGGQGGGGGWEMGLRAPPPLSSRAIPSAKGGGLYVKGRGEVSSNQQTRPRLQPQQFCSFRGMPLRAVRAVCVQCRAFALLPIPGPVCSALSNEWAFNPWFRPHNHTLENALTFLLPHTPEPVAHPWRPPALLAPPACTFRLPTDRLVPPPPRGTCFCPSTRRSLECKPFQWGLI